MSTLDAITASHAPPPGLPDPAELARLASSFFAALPGSPPHVSTPATGGVTLPANPQPAGLSLPPGASGPSTPSAMPLGAIPPGANLAPTSAQSPANAGASAPALVPHSADGLSAELPAARSWMGWLAAEILARARAMHPDISTHGLEELVSGDDLAAPSLAAHWYADAA